MTRIGDDDLENRYPMHVFREPTGAFGLEGVASYFFKPGPSALGWVGQAMDLVKRAYYCAVSGVVQVIRYAGFMHAANVVGSLLSDLPSALRLDAARKSQIPFSQTLPVDPSKVIVLYLPPKDGQWKDYTYLQRQVALAVGEDKVDAQYIEQWLGGGNMKEIHIAQVREKLAQIKEVCPENPIVIVGWSHGAETLPWAFMDPASYSVNDGLLYTDGSRGPRPLTGDVVAVDHVIRLCSPMTEEEVAVMQRVPGVGFTEVCGRFDCLLPSEPQVGEQYQAWIDSGHVGCVFSAQVVEIVAARVLNLHDAAQRRRVVA